MEGWKASAGHAVNLLLQGRSKVRNLMESDMTQDLLLETYLYLSSLLKLKVKSLITWITSVATKNCLYLKFIWHWHNFKLYGR
ncbi:unnamed protein product [Victoria cruziana]